MRRAVIAGLALLVAAAGPTPEPANTAFFPYDVTIDVIGIKQLNADNGHHVISRLMVAGTPTGVNTRELDLYATLVATPDGGGAPYDYLTIGCHPGDIADGRAVIYGLASCDTKELKSLGPKDTITGVRKKTRFKRPSDPNPAHNFTISSTPLQDVALARIIVGPDQGCLEVAAAQAPPDTDRRGISASVGYLVPGVAPAMDKLRIMPVDVCIFASPRKDAVADLEAFGAIYAAPADKPKAARLVGTFSCATQGTDSKQRAGELAVYSLASCNVAPDRFIADHGSTLTIRLGFYFGTASDDSDLGFIDAGTDNIK